MAENSNVKSNSRRVIIKKYMKLEIFPDSQIPEYFDD